MRALTNTNTHIQAHTHIYTQTNTKIHSGQITARFAAGSRQGLIKDDLGEQGGRASKAGASWRSATGRGAVPHALWNTV